MSSRSNRSSKQYLSQQQSNSVANLPTELRQQSTRSAHAEDGNHSDSEQGESACAVTSNGILQKTNFANKDLCNCGVALQLILL